jgi:putative flippase GtrA
MIASPSQATLASRLGIGRTRLAGEFLRFGLVGAAGFVVDAAVLMLALALGLGPWFGRILSYVAAASATFAMNRAWTFREAGRARPMRQWALFLTVNLSGFVCNYGTYGTLIALVPAVAANPVLGVAAGSIAGLAGNFLLTRRFVFGRDAGASRRAGR